MINIFSAEQIKAWDQYTIEHEPISSIDLMERAANAFVKDFVDKFFSIKSVDIVCGPGNNGGDGFAIGRLLVNEGYKVSCHLIDFGSKLSPDCRENYRRFESLGSLNIIRHINTLKLSNELVVDSLFGSGLNRLATGLAEEVIQVINQREVPVVSVDIPSGLFSDKVNVSVQIVQADYTITFQVPKLTFLIPESGKFLGDWKAVDIGLHVDFLKLESPMYSMLEKEDVVGFLPKRKKFDHKGSFGRLLVVAGSAGKMGAAYLSAKAAMKSGTGLLTVHIPKIGYTAFQSLLPEAMVSLDKDELHSSEIDSVKEFDTIAVGPGLGTDAKTKQLLKQLFTSFNKPMIIDADALNIIASERGMLELVPKGSILTPHVGEFHRLFGHHDNGLQRIEKMKKVAKTRGLIIVLKGANSVLAMPNGDAFFNSSGNSGMATAGSGDVLTGVLAGLVSQGIETSKAAMLGVFAHGWAGDIAAKKVGKTSLMASDLLSALPKVFSNVEHIEFI